MKTICSDVLVVGGGIAGCPAAIRAREIGMEVVVMEKQFLRRSGEAATGLDHLAIHFPGEGIEGKEMERMARSTEGLMEPYFAKLVMERSYEMILRIEEWGVKVRDDKGEWIHYPSMFWEGNLHIEGGDIKAVFEKRTRDSGCSIHNRIMLIDFLKRENRVIGGIGLNVRDGEIHIFLAKAIVITTGGCTRLYESPSQINYNRWRNPYNTGDGYGAAFRAGARLKHMEFTMGTLIPKDYGSPGVNGFISAGAKLVNGLGERFMERYAGEAMERTSRHHLAFAVFSEIREGRGPIFLDCRDLSEEKIALLFLGFRNEKPLLIRYLKDRGIDLRRNLLEIELSEPYVRGMMTGGIDVNQDFMTLCEGLFAAGDATAYSSFYSGTGALVHGWIAGEMAADFSKEVEEPRPPPSSLLKDVEGQIKRPLGRKKGIPPQEIERNLQRIMTSYAQYDRNEEGLQQALQRIASLREMADKELMAKDVHELVKAHEVLNMLEIGELVVRAAKERKESRMYLNHRRTDYPKRDDEHWRKHILLKKDGDGIKLEHRELN